jgi:hypothetical protein
MHNEQLGRGSGLMRVDGREIRIRNAFMIRDHSRGSRSVAQYLSHCWINGSFPGNRGFQAYIYKMRNIEGIALSHAMVSQGDAQHLATIEHVEFVGGIEDVGKLHTLVLRSALGEMKVKITDVLSTIPFTMTAPFDLAVGVVNVPHGLVFDEAVRMEWDGKKGLGWSERGFAKLPL